MALTRIASHELECARRYSEVRAEMADSRASITRIHTRIDESFKDRLTKFNQSSRDNKMILSTAVIAALSSMVSIAMHFWK